MLGDKEGLNDMIGYLKDRQKTVRVILLILCDILILNITPLMALVLRFDLKFSSIPAEYLSMAGDYAFINTAAGLFIFALCKLYSSLWRYASVEEVILLVEAVMLDSLIRCALMLLMGLNMPRSYYILCGLFELILVTGERFTYRFLRYIVARFRQHSEKGGDIIRNTMLVGGGDAGRMLVRELLGSRYLNNHLKCIIDDDRQKHGRYISGIQIVGGRDRIMEMVKKYHINDIIIAIPSATNKERRDILNICKDTGCKLRILPGMYQMVRGDIKVSQLREVRIEDLLEREPVEVDLDGIMDYVRDRVVLVTGGGGSIGSELCRQIAKHSPRQLIIFDIYENNAYSIQQELIKTYPKLNLTVLIGSVRNENRLKDIFEQYRPEILYHAAAHKHVPLMEDSPNEAIKNNVFGTLKTAQMADRYGVLKFVLISTDKAVNPTNIMGASKRICEMIIQAMDRHSQTEFVAVRFGNVLGSNGSVIPLFKDQIAHGGPVTVTHPDIVRFFMTIPEAVSLVLQAGAYAKGGEIFVLDMGEPVKILDLAKNLIRLSGYVPDEDIKIEFTGLRPGEKLYEEVLMEEEGLQETANHRIHIGKPLMIDEQWFIDKLKHLDEASYQEYKDIRRLVKELVPEYHYEGKADAKLQNVRSEEPKDVQMPVREAMQEAAAARMG